MFFDMYWLSSHMTIRCSFFVYREPKLQPFLNGLGTAVKQLSDDASKFFVRIFCVVRIVCVDVDVNWFSHTNGITQLH